MATECWLGILMGPDGSSTLWEGSWVSPNVVIGALAPKTKEGEKEEGKTEVHMYLVINQSSSLPISIFLSLCLLFPAPYTRTSNQLAYMQACMVSMYACVHIGVHC